MIIGIGTKNPPKVVACKAVLERIAHKLNLPPGFKFITKTTPSGVPDMPLNQIEMMCGARNRALSLAHELNSKEIKSIFTIGLEGGIFSLNPEQGNQTEYFLQSWVYVYDGQKGCWGSSGAISVPKNIYDPIINQGQELAEVIDKIIGQEDIRSKMGAVGIFTDGLVNRQHFFEDALEFAFAPFYNQNIYG